MLPKITQQEWEEYIKIKSQMDLLQKVENKILSVSYELEKKGGFDPDYEDIDRTILVAGNNVVVNVYSDYEDYTFDITKEQIVE